MVLLTDPQKISAWWELRRVNQSFSMTYAGLLTMSRFFVLILLGKLLAASRNATTPDSIQISPNTYPAARRNNNIFDDFFGTKVADPYRWLEDPYSPETHRFVDELNAISKPFIAQAPSREQIMKRLTKLMDHERYGLPSKHGNFYYYDYNTGLQNQDVIHRQISTKDKGEVFLDPNEISADGTVSLGQTEWTIDGSLLAYELSENGSDWVTVKFRGADKNDLDDVIHGVRHSKLAWLKDNSGIFYSRFPFHKADTRGTSVEKHEFHSLFFHRMGTDYRKDVLVYDRKDHPDDSIQAEVTEDGKFLIIYISRGFSNAIYYYDLSNFKENKGYTEKIDPKPLLDKMDALYQYVDHDKESMLILTNREAPNYKLIRVSLKNGSTWDVVPEHKQHRMESAFAAANNRLILTYIEDVKNTLYIHDLATGLRLHGLPLEPGLVYDIVAKKSRTEVFFEFTSFIIPGIIYKINFELMGKKNVPLLEELRRTRVEGISGEEFAVQQVFYESKDNTKIPMYIISMKKISRNGENPTLLIGYGGFGIPLMPDFSSSNILFLKYFKGIIAVANIRGGGEYGEIWHKNGMREHKQNVFDDFIAAAEYLINNNYTSNKRLAIQGGSNGGLLVAACAQQRPDLYGAVIGEVGLLDMLRFHKFTRGADWIYEYGNPDVKNDFEFIYKYSPLHNIRFPVDGQWPSTLMLTADHDDRVVPSHTLKYAATLYELAKKHPNQTNPLLFCIEHKAGHGQGKPLSKQIDGEVDKFSFLQRVLNLKWTA
ncbi:hypothetical protein RB195_004304 [Necator americanus]|uniref:Prolyl endopeptidase n=1 Tax=Necator americanus TaxID=51031 RepID=A0ABR1BKN3_NECAM